MPVAHEALWLTRIIGHSHLEGAVLRSSDLRGTNFNDAHLEGADLTRADLRWTDLRGATLDHADLRVANLKFANVRPDQIAKVDRVNSNTILPDGMVLHLCRRAILEESSHTENQEPYKITAVLRYKAEKYLWPFSSRWG